MSSQYFGEIQMFPNTFESDYEYLRLSRRWKAQDLRLIFTVSAIPYTCVLKNMFLKTKFLLQS